MFKKILIFLLVFIGLSHPVLASTELGEVTVRDNSGIQISFSTKTTVLEEKIRIVFPTSYTVGENIQIITTGLFDGVTALPINGSNTVASNGLVIEIPITDLEKNKKYGFKIGSGATKNSGSNKTWRISTISEGVEDSYKYAASPEMSTLTITAKTSPLIKDFSTILTSSNDGNLSPNHEVEYTIKYGSNLPYVDMGIAVLQVDWSDSMEIGLLNYVLGSAQVAYGGAEPIVDLINKRISWNITGLPIRRTDLTVGFKLRTNDLYKGADTIVAKVSSRLIRDKLSTPDSTVILGYRYPQNTNNESTSQNTPIPTIVSASPTPIKNQDEIKGKVDTVVLNSVDDNDVKIKIEVSGGLKTIKVKYGLNENDLSKEVTLLVDETTAWLDIPGLEPGKTYYMQIEGSKDTFAFKTAEKSEKSGYETGSLIVTSQNNIVLASKPDSIDESAVLVKGQEYSVRLSLDKSTAIKEAKIYIRNKKILGIDTSGDIKTNSEFVKLLEYERGVFVGNLTTPKNVGEYEIYLRLVDFNGNISEKKVGQLRIVSSLIVKNKKGMGVERAKVILSVFNQTNNIYEEIKSTAITIKNPVYSESNGDVLVALPKGRYRAQVEAIGYEDKEVFFDIGWNSEQKYPEVILEKKPFSFTDVARFYKETNADVFGYTNKYMDSLAESNRFFYLIMTITVAVLIGLSVLSLSFRMQLPVWLLPVWLWFLIKRFFIRDKQQIIEANVVDEDHSWPISRVRVFVMDSEKNTIIAKTYTDKLGVFRINKPKNKDVKFVVFKQNWEGIRELNYSKEALSLGGVRIEMRKIKENLIEKSVKLIMVNILEMMLEVLIALTIIFEVLFVSKFGALRTIPFLIVSILNLLIWLVFVYKMSKKKRIYEKLA